MDEVARTGRRPGTAGGEPDRPGLQRGRTAGGDAAPAQGRLPRRDRLRGDLRRRRQPGRDRRGHPRAPAGLGRRDAAADALEPGQGQRDQGGRRRRGRRAPRVHGRGPLHRPRRTAPPDQGARQRRRRARLPVDRRLAGRVRPPAQPAPAAEQVLQRRRVLDGERRRVRHAVRLQGVPRRGGQAAVPPLRGQAASRSTSRCIALAQLLNLRITEVPVQWIESEGHDGPPGPRPDPDDPGPA